MSKSIIGGIRGSFAGLCCAGLPVALAFLSGIGLGFLINDFIFFPILFVALGFMFYSLYLNKKRHKNTKPIIIGIISTILLGTGIFITQIIWLGIVELFVSMIGDYTITMKNKNC